jgi:hypothetical protein
MFDYCPETRITADEALRHPYFKQIRQIRERENNAQSE